MGALEGSAKPLDDLNLSQVCTNHGEPASPCKPATPPSPTTSKLFGTYSIGPPPHVSLVSVRIGRRRAGMAITSVSTTVGVWAPPRGWCLRLGMVSWPLIEYWTTQIRASWTHSLDWFWILGSGSGGLECVSLHQNPCLIAGAGFRSYGSYGPIPFRCACFPIEALDFDKLTRHPP
jgi:hypothetical protein